MGRACCAGYILPATTNMRMTLNFLLLHSKRHGKPAGMVALTLKTVRPALVRMHRYTGLFLAVVLCVLGLTGSLCTFQDEIDASLNPDLFHAAHPDRHLPPSVLLARLQAQRPAAQVNALLYRPEAGQSVRAFTSNEGAPADELFLDPSNGHIQGERETEGCCFNRRVVMSFLYRVHYSLALGRFGIVFLGLCAILWTVDCLVGLVLTFPLQNRVWQPAFWVRWAPAWGVSFGRAFIRVVFDLHRAVSLWLWIVLLGLAVSGVALTLNDQVFTPVVSTLLPVRPALTAPPGGRFPHGLTLDQAEETAIAFVRAYGESPRPAGVLLAADGSTATFYQFSASGHEVAGLGSPQVTVDLHTGSITRGEIPGMGAVGNIVMQLQFPWHSGRLLGLFGRIVICVSGLAVCLLSVTGVLIWWRKRNPPRRHRKVAA
ncbi:PepSY domain-containing protein [Acetobacter vaccinii]|uniref:PepSY domain-containing protein n=2 Tax=Acetobacter vaccinii TaxID=2592655 RepID=A0A5C1YM20_9PROT|nr:PepSY domain-containing protein [Acetobacter vaccinii]